MNASPRLFSLLAITAALVTALPLSAQKLELPQPSPAASVKQRVGFTDIEIDYSRPGAKGRQVFGGLLPYGVVWRTGANSATKISFSTPVTFGGTKVPAGSYALFSIPGEKTWTVILNSVTNQWGSYTYDAKNDVARAEVAPEALATPVETFTLDIGNVRDDSATLDLTWERTHVAVPLAFDVVPVVTKQIESLMGKDAKPSAQVYDEAALFYLDHNLDLQKAKEWMAAAVTEKPDSFWLYYHQARVLAKLGEKDAAIASARKSIALAAGQGPVAKAEYTRLNEALIASLAP